ncbi:hypothetical protein RRX38_02690 [Pseudomonas sp. DTU_2021_1001937_2_SI_NGA_ILE_001]|uniref:hypothetical protein n=1 Tax=Pseudomonas sp. DTU_2021_1001937_2_SI_NGA_ILE_001 TaxID=3077589 RepID=UPI0028FC1F55|nr:hypothetical protein [Pseudomonas sp. DTU_2021_1001937_2_SI_NGA_ILE_001]WNW10098.1 hypothetical protein RRX38_02690 [Pseudomonas sp. DTU_2021_1001937_2_SI_NGA_ILE_001]
MAAKDIYIKLVDATGKHPDVINHHRVWDGERFYAAQCKLHENPEKPIADRRLVSVVSEAEYLAHQRKEKK